MLGLSRPFDTDRDLSLFMDVAALARARTERHDLSRGLRSRLLAASRRDAGAVRRRLEADLPDQGYA